MLANHAVCALVLDSSTNVFQFWLATVSLYRGLRIYILGSRVFKCSQDHAKRAYFRSLNAIFGKIGRSASEDVVLQRVSSKCLPIRMYATEACGLNQFDIRSLDFVVNRFLMKLFKTANLGIVQECLSYFNSKLPSSFLVTRTRNCLANCENSLCKLFSNYNTAIGLRVTVCKNKSIYACMCIFPCTCVHFFLYVGLLPYLSLVK